MSRKCPGLLHHRFTSEPNSPVLNPKLHFREKIFSKLYQFILVRRWLRFVQAFTKPATVFYQAHRIGRRARLPHHKCVSYVLRYCFV